MNRKGVAAGYFIALLLFLALLFAYLYFKSPNGSATIDSITNFWNTVKWWVLGIVAFIFLWKIGLFKAVAGK